MLKLFLLNALRQHGSPRQVKMGQPNQGEDLGRVLGQALVAPLGVTEWAFDDPENMLHPTPERQGPPHSDSILDFLLFGEAGIVVGHKFMPIACKPTRNRVYSRLLDDRQK